MPSAKVPLVDQKVDLTNPSDVGMKMVAAVGGFVFAFAALAVANGVFDSLTSALGFDDADPTIPVAGE